MPDTGSTSTAGDSQSAGETGFVTVKVNLSDAAWAALQDLARRRNISVTEALQRAIAADTALMDAAPAPGRKGK